MRRHELLEKTRRHPFLVVVFIAECHSLTTAVLFLDRLCLLYIYDEKATIAEIPVRMPHVAKRSVMVITPAPAVAATAVPLAAPIVPIVIPGPPPISVAGTRLSGLYSCHRLGIVSSRRSSTMHRISKWANSWQFDSKFSKVPSKIRFHMSSAMKVREIGQQPAHAQVMAKGYR